MRCLNRNKRPFWYALYSDKNEVVDQSGFRTGQFRVKYGKPVQIRGNISAAKGDASTRQFGDDLSYDKIIVLGDPNVEIDEHCVMWIDRTPNLDAYGELAATESGGYATPHDYIVREVARGLDSVSIAIGRVNVSD